MTVPVGMKGEEPFSTHEVFRGNPAELSEEGRQVTCAGAHPLVSVEARES